MSFNREGQIQLDILNNTIDLDQPCWVCTNSRRGYGNDAYEVYSLKDDYKNGEECDTCNNIRFVPTDEGEAIMALIKRHTRRNDK